MEKIKDFMSGYWKYIILFIVFVLFFLCGYYFGGRTNVQDNGAGIDKIRGQLEEATSNQRKLTEGINGVESGTGVIKGEIEDSQRALDRASENAGNIETNINEAGRIIAEDQHILANVRQRGKSD